MPRTRNKGVYVRLSDAELTELRGLATAQRRTLGAQIATMVVEQLPNLKARRAEDNKQDTKPVEPQQ